MKQKFEVTLTIEFEDGSINKSIILDDIWNLALDYSDCPDVDSIDIQSSTEVTVFSRPLNG